MRRSSRQMVVQATLVEVETTITNAFVRMRYGAFLMQANIVDPSGMACYNGTFFPGRHSHCHYSVEEERCSLLR